MTETKAERYGKRPGKLRADPEREVAIQMFADRVGERIGRLVSEIIIDSLIILWSEKRIHQVPITLQERDDKLLTALEVAQQLSISKAMAYRMIKHGEISSVRIGQAVRVRPHDLENFIAAERI